ncbi:hypothetical protein ACOCEA_01780 [Maribacter sp. CXY002]|uniref:hypothetical protein n=1 Tax=Maribacter luteocoastalis TaxID=3407671 RepID=UPI003B681907
MKELKFYPTIWQTVPFSLDMMDQWDVDGKRIKDLILKNKYASEKGVSQMNVNVIKFSAIDKKGNEHIITDFSGNESMQLKGMHTGLFIKTKSVLKLDSGSYSTFRFYLSSKGNEFIYDDRSKEPLYRFDHLDFEIVNGLELSGDESKQVLLRFDFEPFSLLSYLKPFQKFLQGIKFKKMKWASSYSH